MADPRTSHAVGRRGGARGGERGRSRSRRPTRRPIPPPNTPIKHVVVIFGENQSFDHYFGTYPNATERDARRAARSSTGPATPVRSTLQTPVDC